MTPTRGSRTAVGTGGTGGLGTAICALLAQTGHRVVAADLGPLDGRADALRAAIPGHDVDCVALDVTDFDACTGAFADIARRHGDVGILVNAAGITRDGTLRKMAHPQWRQVMDVNLDGVFHCTRQVVDGMAAGGFGRIVNISSVNGQTGQFGQTNYAAAKAGMHGFTMSLARELARKGVPVNSISPGYVDTALVMAMPANIRDGIVAQVPVGRLGRADEIARVVGFLVDDDAGYITGANIPVNGGLFMSF